MNSEFITRALVSGNSIFAHSHEKQREIANSFLVAFNRGDAPAFPQALDQFPGLRSAYETLYWCGLVSSSDCAMECQLLVHDIQATMYCSYLNL